MSQSAQRMSRANQATDAAPASPIVNFLPSAGSDFVNTPYVQDLTDRALAYLDVGYAVHLSGPAGTGKSTLAMHIASRLGRSCTLLHGDDEYRGSDLIGRDSGYHRTSIKDNYVSSIMKTEETLSTIWASNRLTTACQQGHTLIYDEFTRSPATANNPLLSVLEEGILNIPSSGEAKGYIQVHPDFRAIFTSNPEEYAGVHKTQDALLDRMITIELDHPDRETEASIVVSKSGLSMADALLVVGIIREVRRLCGQRHGPTVRAALAISQVVCHRGCRIDVADPVFQITCQDVLFFNASRQSNRNVDREMIRSIVSNVCSGIQQNQSANQATNQTTNQPLTKVSIETRPVAQQKAASGEFELLQVTQSLANDARAAAIQSTSAIQPTKNQFTPAPVNSQTQAKRQAEGFSPSEAAEDETLSAAIKNFENLATAVRHLPPATKTLPRPPAMATSASPTNVAATP